MCHIAKQMAEGLKKLGISDQFPLIHHFSSSEFKTAPKTT